MGLLDAIRDWNERRQEAKELQAELKERFAQAGMNFMQLHPTIHGALLKEAMALGSDVAFFSFGMLAKEVEAMPGLTADQKARVLIERFRERGASFDEEAQA